MPTGWTPAAASSTLGEWTRTFSRGQQCSCFRITVFYGVRTGEQKVCERGPKIWNLMTVVDRLDELQASSVGRIECSSTRQRTGARRMDVHVDTYSQPCLRRRAEATAHARVMEVSQGSGVCAWSCCHSEWKYNMSQAIHPCH